MTKQTSNGKSSPRGAEKVPADKGREQAEEHARAEFDRLLSPSQAPSSSAPAATAPVATPSLEQRLADIDRRAKENAVREKAALAQHYLMEARSAFRRAVSKTTDEAVKDAYENMQRLEKMVTDAGNAPAGGTGRESAASADGERPTRERRSPDSLRSDAQKLAAWLKDHPNSKGSAATEATGVTVKPPLNVRTFVEKYLPGTKVKTEGQKAGTLYSIH